MRKNNFGFLSAAVGKCVKKKQPNTHTHTSWIWDCHSSDYEECSLLRCSAVQFRELAHSHTVCFKLAVAYLRLDFPCMVHPASWACFCLFLAWPVLWPWRWRQYVPLKCHALAELLGVTSSQSPQTQFILLIIVCLYTREKKISDRHY
jgi:hypothetical protein